MKSVETARTSQSSGRPAKPSKNQVLINLSVSDSTQFGKTDFAMQTTPQKIFSATWALEAEVNNGGFSQYFMNDSNETASFAAEALDAIGAPQTAGICRRAILVAFPNGLPATPQAASAAAGDFSDDVLERLRTLDDEFYAYPHNLTDLLFAYVSKHPEEFGELPNDSF